MKRYYVCICLECSKPIIYTVEYLVKENDCCIEFNNHKILKVFNDEKEAKKFLELHETD